MIIFLEAPFNLAFESLIKARRATTRDSFGFALFPSFTNTIWVKVKSKPVRMLAPNLSFQNCQHNLGYSKLINVSKSSSF